MLARWAAARPSPAAKNTSRISAAERRVPRSHDTERGPFHELHRHEHRRPERPDVVHGHHVGVGELRQGLRLAKQPLRPERISIAPDG